MHLRYHHTGKSPNVWVDIKVLRLLFGFTRSMSCLSRFASHVPAFLLEKQWRGSFSMFRHADPVYQLRRGLYYSTLHRQHRPPFPGKILAGQIFFAFLHGTAWSAIPSYYARRQFDGQRLTSSLLVSIHVLVFASQSEGARTSGSRRPFLYVRKCNQ